MVRLDELPDQTPAMLRVTVTLECELPAHMIKVWTGQLYDLVPEDGKLSLTVDGGQP